MSHTTIELVDVTLTYPRRQTASNILANLLRLRSRGSHTYTALDSVSLKIQDSEVVGIIGHNGAGKSTLLRTMCGVYPPNGGTVRVAGRVTLLAAFGAGFNTHLSGRDNLYLYGSILGHSRRTLNALYDSIVEFSGLGDFIDQPLRTYSSGMRARLGFSVATAVRPEILLIDEVFAVGDIEFRERSRERIHEIVKEAGTVVIVSHSDSLLSTLCNRLLLVEHGKIAASGSPQEVLDIYNAGRGQAQPPKQTSPRSRRARRQRRAAGKGTA